MNTTQRWTLYSLAALLTVGCQHPGRPTVWNDLPVGLTAATGPHPLTQGTLTLSGTGAGLNFNRDQVQFCAVPAQGDVEIVARIASFDGAAGAQVGLMLRTSDNPTANVAAVVLHLKTEKDGRNRINLLTREPASPYSSLAIGWLPGGPTGLQVPLWLKLIRVGNDYAVYKSADGQVWGCVHNGSGGPCLAQGQILAGVFVAGGKSGQTATAVLDNIHIGRPRLEYHTSWLGNTFNQDSTGYISAQALSLYVAPDGTCYTMTWYDETGEPAKIYRDGKVVKAFEHAAPGNRIPMGYAVTGDGQHLYYPSRGTGAGGRPESYLLQADRLTTANSARVIKTEDNLVRTQNDPNGESVIRGLAAGNHELYLSDTASNRILVADLQKMEQVQDRSFPFDRPGPMVVDKRGELWIIQLARTHGGPCGPWTDAGVAVDTPGVLKCYTKDGKFTGREITDLVNPTALAVDPTQDRLLVCENGPDQNVRIYTHLADAPVCTSTFGVKGGVWAGKTPGRIHDDTAGGDARFYIPTGVGVDGQGNLYVQSAGAGTDLRKFTPDGKLVWQVCALAMVDSGDFDPASDGRDVYGTFKHYTLDWTKTTPGGEWGYAGYLWDPFQYGPVRWASAVVRRVGPHQSLVMYTATAGANADPCLIFRVAGEQAIPCGRISRVDKADKTSEYQVWVDRNGDGHEQPDEVAKIPHSALQIGSFDVDSHGDIWIAAPHPDRCTIRHFLCLGVDERRTPRYGVQKGDFEDILFPDCLGRGWGNTSRLHYDRQHDVMYLLTGDKVLKPADIGRLLARFDNWSKGNRKPAFLVSIPGPGLQPAAMYAAPYPGGQPGFSAMDVAGDYIFLAELWGPIHVFDHSTGKQVTILNGGPETSGLLVWEDTCMGLRAFQRANGEYVILSENAGFRARNNLFRWRPSRALLGTAPGSRW